MKRLILCRHAKSSWKDMTLRDMERPLNKRGKRDAPEMGRRLAVQGIIPDMIMSSPARRALKTARQLAKATGVGKKNIMVREEIYAATADELLEIVRGLDNSVSLVIIVGHNPETTELANALGNLDIYNVPTCGIVAFDLPVSSWKDIRKGMGRMAFFDFPRNRGADLPNGSS